MSDNISQDIAIRGEGNIVVGKGDVIINPLPPAEARLRHDLGILLKNVDMTWIKGVLEKSVHEAALLELGMELREEAIDNPWRMVMEGPDQSRQTLPRGKKIKDIFYEANGLLLILGEPGSGKTTTLLQLARDLISEVDKEFTQPVPVILNLSTWINKQQPLDEWLVAELNSKYRLPKKDGKRWLSERRILPLLDGLDEVKAENRAACVENINQLVSEYGLQGLVVCSRIKDYTALDVRLAFYRAIYLQPLTPEQVDAYLESAGEKLASLRATLQADEALRSMAQSPLILNIMSLAYKNTSAEALSDSVLATNEARRQHLFDAYMTRMFSRKAGARPYKDEQTKQWLSWLAQNMQRHNQEIFLIENLQPSWLPTRGWQWIYTLLSRLSGNLIAWLILFGLFIRFGVLIGGLSTGLPVGFIDALRFEWIRKRRGVQKSQTFWWSVANVAIVALAVGFSIQLLYGRTMGLIFGSVFGLIFGLRGSRQHLENDIETVEALRWSWHKAFIGGLISGIVGLIFGLIVGSIAVLSKDLIDTLISGLLGGLIFGVMFIPIGAILIGLHHEIMETKSVPNQGIRLSIRNAIFGGMIAGLIVGPSAGLIVGLGYALYNGLSYGLNEGLKWGLAIGVYIGLMGVLWYGGLDVIQHYILRLILIIQGHTPANYALFLDYAVDRIFLQKVGGGYRFIHRLLLEHFADMGETKKYNNSN